MAKSTSIKKISLKDKTFIMDTLSRLEKDLKANPRLKELFKKKPELVAARYGFSEDVQHLIIKDVAAACGGGGTCEVTCEMSCLVTCMHTSGGLEIQDWVTKVSNSVFK